MSAVSIGKEIIANEHNTNSILVTMYRDDRLRWQGKKKTRILY